ncbi:protein ROOT HAIR DEFECTIVE 3-like isoform X2 [Triticum aestivum]|uniref:protein ROOT HAIR DEFECTIVE 3-like isoform X2 n=1 Tax=Triticum aestivum TaxID=4565 RepID=UPI001D012D36|nr:protein ROOT HAIR DEFECTIVE 3-like isoform X2 [Triticum aestivum]
MPESMTFSLRRRLLRQCSSLQKQGNKKEACKKTVHFFSEQTPLEAERTMPFENIVADLREDVQQIWDGVQKPQTHTDAPLSDFFNIQFEGLSNYEENPDLFKNQVSTLRNWFRKSIGHAGPSGNQHGVVPASGFSYSTNEIWKCIKEDKDLNLPKHKVMVATVRCGQISSEKVAIFIADQDWKHFKETVQNYYVPGFGKKISTLLDRCLSEYDTECIYYDDGVRTSIRQQLESEILKLVYPAYKSLMKHLLNGTLKAFEESFHKAQKKQEFEVAARDCTQSFLHKFTKGCEDATIQQMTWDPATFKNKLKHAIDAHVESVRVLKLKVADLCGRSEGRLTRALAEQVKEFLRSAPYNAWEAIKTLLVAETRATAADLEDALLDWKVDEGTVKELLSTLENHGKSVVESKAKEEAATISIRMKDRFTILFNADMSGARNGKVDIQAIAESARDECMVMLWIISAIRLDGDGDTFENFRSLLVLDKSWQLDPLASISRKKELILKEGTLISLDNCKLLWSQFMVHVDCIVTLVLLAEGRLTRALAEQVKEFLRSAQSNTWEAIETLLVCETIAAAADLKYDLLDWKVDEGTVKELLSTLENHGKSVVESKATEEAATVSIRMKDRFTKLFNADMSKGRNGKVDIQAIVESARDECMMMLWILSAIRLDGASDTFENFRSLLLHKSCQLDTIGHSELILKAGTLISSDNCKLLWSQFMVQVDSIVPQVVHAEGRLIRALAEPVDEFLRSARDNTWEAIKTLLVSETIFAAGDLKCALLHFEPNEGTMKELLSRLENHGRSVIKSKAKEEAATVSIRMKDRFAKLFNNDAPISRVQKEEVDIKAIAKSAQDECMMMLWIILAIRLDGEGDTIENFRSLLLDEGPQTTDKSYQYDPLSSISWKMAGTLISPVQCKSLWSKFMVEVDSIVKPARDAQFKRRIRDVLLLLRVAVSLGTGMPIPF